MTLGPLLAFNFRYYRRHALLSLLCLLGIMLGVGIVVAVELINESALSSFSRSVDALSGRATHSIASQYGRIYEQDFARIWRHPQVEAVAPVVDVMAETLETGSDTIRFLGIDPFLDADFRPAAVASGDEAFLAEFLGAHGPAVWLSASFMRRHGLKPGQRLTVLTAGIEKQARILGALPSAAEANLGENTAIMDIAAAQDVFGRKGFLDRIDVIVKGDPKRLAADLPPGLMLTDAESRKAVLESMLYSFQLNLAAMSLLALFVGVFLIYNFSMFSVLSRREDMSLLMTLGVDRKELVVAFIGESLLLGALGSVIGVAFGYLTATLGIDRVSSTISELYFQVDARAVTLTPRVTLSGLGVGFAATFLGILIPALEVSSTPPVIGLKRQSIEDRAHGLKGLLLACGLTLVVVSASAAWASRFSVYWGFASAFVMTLAFALFTPSFLSPFTHYLGAALRKYAGSIEGFLAARTIKASLSRTSIAVAALASALAMTIGVDTMIYSFRTSVAAWLKAALQGDLYISPATTKWDHPLPESLIQRLEQDPRIDGVERYATYTVYLDGRPVKLRVIDASVLKRHARFRFLSREQGAWEAMENGGVFISESLAFKFGYKVGDAIELATPTGQKRFPVVAEVRDYSSDQGTIQIHREVYEKFWNDHRVQSAAIFLKPGESIEAVRDSIKDMFPGLDRAIATNTRMRENILVIFDKTFAPTAALKGVSLLVALLGVATALMAILMERSRDMTVLSCLGLTPRQLGAMNIWQSLVMGVAAFLISVVCGLALTYIIVYAINYRSFGWSIDIAVDPRVFAKTFFLTMTACFVSSLYPTYRLLGLASSQVRDE
ncbi:MAG: ABC transporter permease [Desulfomonilaceae bacterium]